MPQGPVTTYKQTQANLLISLLSQSNTLKVNPKAALEVSKALLGLVPKVQTLKAASMAMVKSARFNPYVTAKPFGYFSYDIPRMCDDIVACLLHWADMLVFTDGRRTDIIVILGIEGVVGSLSV
jgi:hypothetical protein